MSEWLKDRFYTSRALQFSYASWIDLKSRAALFQGDSSAAVSELLLLWKQLGAERFGEERKSRLMQLVHESCYRDGKLAPIAENRLHNEFAASSKANEIRNRYANLTLDDRVRLRFPNDDDPERQGDLMIIKSYDPATGERGVVMIKYSETILALPAVFDLTQLASRYMLVLEPSFWGYQDLRFFLYLGSDLDVLVQSPRLEDYEFIESLDTNLVPIRVGAGEWSDPSVFRPHDSNTKKSFDVVMVAAWDPFKRHEVFFRAAVQLKERGRAICFALVGYNLGWTREPIERLLRRYDLENDCTIFEDIPHAEVARVVADSKVSLLLSQREGANKAIYESMFCGTPIIVYRRQCGINLDHVNARTGVLAGDDELADAILHVLDHTADFDPRGWAIENVGHAHATRKINAALAEMDARRDFLWTRDVVAKKNAPNLRYAEPGRYREFAEEYQHLSEFLRPVD
jgi:glycosyltransferase involved in cell wall biosynthesis